MKNALTPLLLKPLAQQHLPLPKGEGRFGIRKQKKRNQGEGCKLVLFVICNLLFVVFASVAFAADGTSFDPSSQLYSARQIGLGGASLGFSGDANNVFSNPAGLTNIKFPKFSRPTTYVSLNSKKEYAIYQCQRLLPNHA